ncbi:hypothetical protein [Streptomyces sp. YIM 98790]|uniref:hypothetical protein n=1 Tax=Streptomyces sp. YIM 98790 TaxID=2689077 RepID=UPI00140A920F|nr:hypothetical protein [Streptomyces sp. YIM 98790]
MKKIALSAAAAVAAVMALAGPALADGQTQEAGSPAAQTQEPTGGTEPQSVQTMGNLWD